MRIRRANQDDAAKIQQLYDNDRNNDRVLGLPYEESDWRLYLGAAHVIILVAEDCGQIIGFLLGYDLVNWAYIETLVVNRLARDRGVGSTLLEHFERLGDGKWVATELCLDPDDRSLADWLSRRGYGKPDLIEWRVKLTPLWKSTRPPIDLTGTNPSASCG